MNKYSFIPAFVVGAVVGFCLMDLFKTSSRASIPKLTIRDRLKHAADQNDIEEVDRLLDIMNSYSK